MSCRSALLHEHGPIFVCVSQDVRRVPARPRSPTYVENYGIVAPARLISPCSIVSWGWCQALDGATFPGYRAQQVDAPGPQRPAGRVLERVAILQALPVAQR